MRERLVNVMLGGTLLLLTAPLAAMLATAVIIDAGLQNSTLRSMTVMEPKQIARIGRDLHLLGSTTLKVLKALF